MDMFKSLANLNYENSAELVHDVKHLNFIDDHLLLTDFDISPMKFKGFEENIDPLYILDIDEDITKYFEGRENWMALDQGEVENIDV